MLDEAIAVGINCAPDLRSDVLYSLKLQTSRKCEF